MLRHCGERTVPKREIVLALTLLAPLNSQSAYDALRLASVGPLSTAVLHEFLARNPIAARLFINRAKALERRSNLPLAGGYRAWAEASRAVERAASTLEGL